MHMKALFALLALAAAAFAADANVAGRWSGSMSLTAPDGQTRDGTVLFLFQQSGNSVTGTAGPSDDNQMAISNGKTEGDRLTFQVVGDQVDFKFELKIDKPEHMAGEVAGTLNGQELKIKLDLSRAK